MKMENLSYIARDSQQLIGIIPSKDVTMLLEGFWHASEAGGVAKKKEIAAFHATASQKVYEIVREIVCRNVEEIGATFEIAMSHTYARVPTHDATIAIPTSGGPSSNPASASAVPGAAPLSSNTALNNPINRQPKRTTKTSQKQVLFPADADAADDDVLASGIGTGDIPPRHSAPFSQQQQQQQQQQQASYKTTQKEEFLRRVNKESLPRATAYCTCSRYNMDALMEYLFSRKVTNGTAPRRYDEALYTPYSFSPFGFSPYDFNDSSNTAVEDANLSSSLSNKPLIQTDPASFKMQMPIENQANFSNGISERSDSSPDGFIVSNGLSSHSTTVHGHTPPAAVAFAASASATGSSSASFSAAAPGVNGGNNNAAGSLLSGGTSFGDFSDTIEAVGAGSYKDLVRRTTVPELIFFDFGVVVMWGLTEEEEYEILDDIRPFEEESINHNDLESEKFHYLYSRQQQARIYNDIITLISPTSSVMIKLTISYAFAQSAKLTLFEGLIEETIESTRRIPTVMAETGKIHMHRKAINKKIGQFPMYWTLRKSSGQSQLLNHCELILFAPRMHQLGFNSNIRYTAIRGYLEINQRVDLVNQRVAVISDLLAMLKDNLTSTHGEQLEWIVIFLISLEIVIGLITIFVDLSSYLG
ncbi:hypothetical protein HK100_012423 [Physocladia obscura]|uniref:DUF155 domain-containing protein n=1 Tax=Physocladia obscura TaxID=109957 RepID=A0AAD5TAR7_9FUNG|nr:hypothetical protein HK100_012423 [Physocladia obscura]